MVTIEEVNQTNSSGGSSSSESEDGDDYASKNTATERKRNRVVQRKVNFENEDHSDDDDDDDDRYDESGQSEEDHVFNDDQSSTNNDDDDDDGSSSSRSEFEDDDQDIDNESDDQVHDKKIKVNDDQLRHIPISERLRHIQMEQGINQNYKEDRKRKYKQSQQVIQTVKEQILQRKNDDTKAVTKQSMKTNHDKSKKKSKHAPTLMSSKRSDFYERQRLDLQAGGVSAIGTNIQAHTNVYKGRDPRSLIDATTSSTNQNNNKRGGKKLLETIKGTSNSANQLEDYAFVQEMRNEEIQTLQKRIKARQITGRKGQEQRRRYNVQNTDSDGLVEDQSELHRLQQERATYERHQLDIATKRAVQARLRESNPKRQRDDTDEAEEEDIKAHPHAPSSKYVPKVRELKRMYLETKYDLISQQRKGKNTIDKMILKKHKRNKSKDSKKHHL